MSLRILIVVDSDSVLHMIEALVASRGYDVTTAQTGARGLEEALARAPDLVLVDLDLPGPFDGLEVCKRLRQSAPTLTVPIIALSSLEDDEAKAAAHEAGVSAYYTKPFSPSSLAKEIESIRTRRNSSMKIRVKE